MYRIVTRTITNAPSRKVDFFGRRILASFPGSLGMELGGDKREMQLHGAKVCS